MVYYTNEMFVPSPGLVPANADQWLFDDSYWREEWGTRRKLAFFDWDSHVVAEGMVTDEWQLKRAIRDEEGRS